MVDTNKASSIVKENGVETTTSAEDKDQSVAGGSGNVPTKKRGFVSAQRRYDNVRVRDSEMLKRVCQECGAVLVGAEKEYQVRKRAIDWRIVISQQVLNLNTFRSTLSDTSALT